MKRLLSIIIVIMVMTNSVIFTRVIAAEDEGIITTEETDKDTSTSDNEDPSGSDEDEQPVTSADENTLNTEAEESEINEETQEDEVVESVINDSNIDQSAITAETQASDLTVLETGSCGDNVTYTIYSDYSMVISGTGDMTDSPWYDGYRTHINKVTIEEGITSIGDFAFDRCSSLTSITIPGSVTSIGEYAFQNCSSLTSITIPDSVTSINDGAFICCYSLKSVHLGNSVTTIGKDSFNSCYSLISINIPDSVTSIGEIAFCGCSSLSSITVSPGNTVYDSRNNCNAIIETASNTIKVGCNNTVIPDSVTSIGDDAFGGYTSLTSITIPDSVTSIEAYAFSGCSSLSSIIIPDSVIDIGDGAFFDCYPLSVYVPDTIDIIKDNAFSGIAAIYTNAAAKSLGWSNRWCDESRTKVNYGYSLDDYLNGVIEKGFCGDNITYTIYGDYSMVISGTGDMTDSPWHDEYGAHINKVTIEEGITSICDSAFSGGSSLTSIIIPDSVTSIGEYAFQDCYSLTSITIPDSVTSIGSGAFSYCSSLSSITVSPGNTVYDSRNNCNAIIETASNTIKVGCNNTVIPDSVTSIGDDAFGGYTSLTSITIPDSVTSIGSGAFSYCSSLTSIIIPDSVTNIGNAAFSYCSSLTYIIIPDSVTNIGNAAFDMCCSLVAYVPDTVDTIESYAFSSIATIYTNAVEKKSGWSDQWCYSGTKVYFGSSLQEYNNRESTIIETGCCGDNITYTIYGDYSMVISGTGDMTDSPWHDEYGAHINKVTIEEGITSIGDFAFSECYSITSIIIPDSVSNIGNDAFAFCSSLTSITIPNSVTSLDYNTFYFCSKLASVRIGDSVANIGSSAFSYCRSLVSITIPDSVTSIGNSAFDSCSSLTSIIIPDSVTSIGDHAFYGCSSLTSIIIPDSVTSIGNSAFYLNDVNYPDRLGSSLFLPGTVQDIGENAFSGIKEIYTDAPYKQDGWDDSWCSPTTIVHYRTNKKDYDAVHGLYNISFNGNGATSGQMDPMSDLKKNRLHILSTNTFARIGYLFEGWNTQSDGSGVSFEDQEEIDYLTLDIDGDIILYAQWRYDSEYGMIDPNDISTYESLGRPEALWTSKLEDLVYDPLVKSYTQEIRVYDHNVRLKEGTDYSIKYSNNTKVGKASFTITGKGDYIGTYTGYFNILPKQFDDEFKIVLNNDSFKYANGKVLRPTVSVEYKGVKLKDKTDYTVSYENINSRSPGHYFANIKGSGNYEGTLTASYQIMESDSELIPISSVKISSIKKKTYTGDPLVQDLILTDGKTTLKKGTDYEIVYYDNIDAGTAYLTISGMGDYTGSITKSFKIEPLKLTTKNTSIDKLPVSLEYEGKALRPDIDVYLDGKILALDEDYTLTFSNNINVGTAKITVKGTGNYTGTITKNFKIVKKEIPEQSISVADDFAYEKGGVMSVPKIIIDGTQLVYNKDFTVSYKNNKAVNDGYDIAKTPLMTVTGKGNYTGKCEYYFTIHEKDISEVDIYIPDKVYSNKANAYKSTPVLTDTNGKKLSAGTDYDKNYDYFIDDKPVTGIPSPGTTVTVKVTGKGNYKGSVIGEYRIVSYDINKAKVTIPVQYYTGRPIKPSYDDITVTFNKIQLSKDDYEIVSYTNNINKGTAKLTIKGKGQYGGTKTINFTIKQRSLGNTIHFNLNGGSGTLNDQLIYKDTALSNYNGKKTVNGITYTFKGWSTVLNGDIIYRNKQLFTYDPKMAGRTVTLYAVWE